MSRRPSSAASAAGSRSEETADFAPDRPARLRAAGGGGRSPASAAAFWLPMAVWGYVSGIHGSVAPFLAESFGLSDAELARLWTWVGLSSLGALALGRQADRIGRRRVLLLAFAALPLAAVGTACATGPASYVLGQALAYAAGGTLLAVVTVSIAEELPDGERARGQGRAGLALAAASAAPLLLVTALAPRPDLWRPVWALAGVALGALPWARRRFPETARWRDARGCGATARAGMVHVFRHRHRRRALTVLGAVVLVQAVELSARAWLFFHPVRSLGIAPARAAAVLVTCGGLGLLGFRAGGWMSDRLGRRRTFALTGALFAAGTVATYGGTLGTAPGRLAPFAVSLLALAFGGNAALVAFRSLTVELFPTELRGTVAGWLGVGSALGWIGGMGAVALLAGPLGGVGPAVALLAAAALPAAIALLASLPETAGRSLESAAAPARRPALYRA